MAFDIAHGAAYFRNDDIGIRAEGDVVNARFDFIGAVRDELNSFAEVIALALFADNVFENLTRGEVVEFRQSAISETFIMSQVEIGLSAIIEDVDFPVLVWGHGARVDVEVGVELLQDH